MQKVLIVDDTKNIRMLLTKCLEMEGYQVDTANDGNQAVEMFSRNKYDMAFLDIKMPYHSGTEVLKHIRDLGIKTPVIIITAYATIKNAVECTKMGAVAYLQKPFTADKVRNILLELKAAQFIDEVEETGDFSDIESLIEGEKFGEALKLLKNMLAEKPLEAELYLLLSKASEGIGHTQDAGKYRKIYETIK